MENDDDVLEFFVKMHIFHCLPFTFPGISIDITTAYCFMLYDRVFRFEKICCADRSWKFIFWSWKIFVEKDW